MRLERTALCAFALIALVLVPPSSAYVRTDVVDENYLTGYLYWQNGRGGISWNEPHASDDDVDPGNNSVGLFDDFLSEPVPKALYLNASRVIQLDLFFRSARSPNMDVEIRVGSSFLTGGRTENGQVLWGQPGCSGCADDSLRPRAAGYAVTTYRMQAEIDLIQQDSVMSVRLVHRDANKVQYGLAGDHVSVLRLPLFSGDEVLYRVPRYADAGPSSGGLNPLPPLVDPVQGLVEQVLGPRAGMAAAFVVFGAGLPGSKKRRAGLWMLAFTILGFSGCVGSHDYGPGAVDSLASPGLGGSARSYFAIDSTNETGFANSTRGSIFGVIGDSDNLPVGGAFVALLATSFSARTDPNGRFHFADLIPGQFHLRVDREGFKAYEGTVQVRAASITKVEIVLEFIDAKELNQRPHRHDYWGDRSTLVLMNRTDLGYTCSGNGLVPNCSPRGEFRLEPSPSEFRTIVPGTRMIQIMVDWDPNSIPSPWVALGFQANNDPNPANITYLLPRARGDAFHIATTWEMEDSGHQRASTWNFVIQASGSLPPTYRLQPTGFQVSLMIGKGVVPLEPPHPSYWIRGDAVRVVDATLWIDCTGTPAGVLENGYPYPFTGCSSYHFEPKHVVPFDASWMNFTLKQDRELTVPFDWQLWARPANVPPTPPPSNYFMVANGKRIDPLTMTWNVTLGQEQADPVYMRKSIWDFYVVASDGNARWVDSFTHYLVDKVDLHLLATAHK